MKNQERGALIDLSVSAFLDALASRTPVPGGGAVAGAAGALACALGRMVGAYSIGKKTTDADRSVLELLLERLGRADAMMRTLIDEDARAYAAYAEASRGKGKDEASIRDRAAALDLAITVPLSIGATAGECLVVFQDLASRASRVMLSDLEAAAILAEAAVRCAACSVRVNAGEVRDDSHREALRAALERIEGAARRRLDAVTAILRRRVEVNS